MALPMLQDIFQLKCLINNINIVKCARVENGVKQLLALVTNEGNIVLYYTFGELPAVIKHIPWHTESGKSIEAICFDSTATWLLVVTLDNSFYIIPALSLVDKKQKIDCKWSVTDSTVFVKHTNTPDSRPTYVVWWQTLDCNQNALVGYTNGAIGLTSLTDGRCLGTCTINEPVVKLQLCQDSSVDSVFLLINGKSGQQWRLMLEQSSGCVWPPESSNSAAEDSTKSRLHNLKQLGVDKLVSLKQRIVEGKHSRRNSQTSDTTSESSHSEHSLSTTPELLPHLCDTYFSPQYARNRYLFCAFYKPSSLLTIHAADVESAPIYVHKLPSQSDFIVLSDKLMYVLDDSGNTVSVISTELSECRLEGDTDFNSESLVGQFSLEKCNEKVLTIYKVTDTTILKNKNDHRKDKTFTLPKSIDEINIPKMKIDTCIVVTNYSVYKIVIRCSPIKKFISLVNDDWNLVKAERVAVVFGLSVQQLIETCGDLLIGNGMFQQGLLLYKQAKVHLLKRVLKLAVFADSEALLKFINLCLCAGKIDMPMATKIHIENLAVMAHTERILRHPGYSRENYTKDFMTFLAYEKYYDEILAVNVACQANQWNIVSLLAKCRGLQPEVVSALSLVIQSSRTVRQTDDWFYHAISEPSLTQSLLLSSNSVVIFKYIQEHLNEFNADILKRFAAQLDPSQPCAMLIVSRIFQNNKHDSSLENSMDFNDYDNSQSNLIIKELLETYIMVLLQLIDKCGDNSYNINLLEKMGVPEQHVDYQTIEKFPTLRHLSCGYAHAAIIRNNCVYTTGLTNSGCLGLGPLLTLSSSPKIVETLVELKVKVLSISCGRKHTLALTDNGVYSWGSNSYGQLGLGPIIQKTAYPQLLSSIYDKNVVDIVAGQYHSLALTSGGAVYTWGWGIHGQLGHGNCNNQYVPKLLQLKFPVMQIAAGHAHSLVLNTEGRVYGFGSNCFGQLGECNIEGTKSTAPVWVMILPDIYTPIVKIAAAYFHNVAVRADNEVYTWGANPQEVRISQSRYGHKLNGFNGKVNESWKSSLNVYSGCGQKPVEEVAVGYRHTTILHNGKLLWGCSRDVELGEPKVRDQDVPGGYGQRFTSVSCGPDYIMAIEQSGRVLAWGNSNMAQTILGRSYDENSRQTDSKVLVMRNTKRIIKIPSSVPASSEGYPFEVPDLPTLAITFNTDDLRNALNKKRSFYPILSIENAPPNMESIKSLNRGNFKSSFINDVPDFKVGQKTLHYVLETYFGYYDVESVSSKCLQLKNFQAASKLAMMDGHYSDSLNYQLAAFKTYMDSFNLELDMYTKTDDYDKIDFAGIKFEFNSNSPAHMLSASSSLDSIRQWGDDLDHQGGSESPCEITEMIDIKQSMTQYVHSIKNENSSITSVSKLVEKPTLNQDKFICSINNEVDALFKDQKTKEIIKTSALLIEFYLKRTCNTGNHILMQNILLKCIEFWLNNSLPISILEMILLRNMDKYFYSLSILLFCKNFNNNLADDINELKRPTSAKFLKEFSTKFCLQLCSMVLENVNKS